MFGEPIYWASKNAIYQSCGHHRQPIPDCILILTYSATTPVFPSLYAAINGCSMRVRGCGRFSGSRDKHWLTNIHMLTENLALGRLLTLPCTIELNRGTGDSKHSEGNGCSPIAISYKLTPKTTMVFKTYGCTGHI